MLGDASAKRVAIVNTWWSIDPANHPIIATLFAVLDQRTVEVSDVAHDCLPGPMPPRPEVVGIERVLACLCMHSPNHAWYCYRKMLRREALAFLTYDSEKPEFPVMHITFEDPSTPEGAPHRLSCECGVLVLVPRDWDGLERESLGCRLLGTSP